MEEIIRVLQNEIEESIANKDSPNAKDWSKEKGVLISRAQATKIVEVLKENESRISKIEDLREQLKEAHNEIYGLNDEIKGLMRG